MCALVSRRLEWPADVAVDDLQASLRLGTGARVVYVKLLTLDSGRSWMATLSRPVVPSIASRQGSLVASLTTRQSELQRSTTQSSPSNQDEIKFFLNEGMKSTLLISTCFNSPWTTVTPQIVPWLTAWMTKLSPSMTG